MRIKMLRDKKAGLLTEASALTAKYDDGTISPEETTRLSALTDDDGELDKVNVEIKREERLMEERRSMEASADINADTPAEAADKLPAQVKKDPDKFPDLGEFLQAVSYTAMNPNGSRDNRLIYAAPTGAGEAVPSDGGFLVQADHSTALLELVHDAGDIMSRTRRIPISANSNGIKLPAIDESSRVDGSRWGGVQAYWANEADAATGTKPKFREIEMSLKKLFGLGYVTEELLADSTALASVMTQAFTEEIAFKAENAIVNGTGAGQPLGIINSGALVSIAKESGQAASTVVTANVLNMLARLPRRSARNAIWLINQDILPQLWQLTLGSGTAVTLLYAPPGQGTSAQNAPYGTLLGRPVFPVEYCSTLGTKGDIFLCDLSQYLMIDKGGIAQAASMHVRFLNDEMTFRWIYRLDGQPAWNVPVTPFKGSNTQSPFLTLDTRA